MRVYKVWDLNVSFERFTVSPKQGARVHEIWLAEELETQLFRAMLR
jgi:hypothetical protein